MAYRPVWTRAVTQQGVVPAITFSANRTHERYAPGLSTEQVAHYLATGEGPLGLACDYLYDTATKLRELGICDRSLDALEARVRAARCSTP
jgi:cation transport protein ChaC